MTVDRDTNRLSQSWRRPDFASKHEIISERNDTAEVSPIVNGNGDMRTKIRMSPISTRVPELAMTGSERDGPKQQGDSSSHSRNEPVLPCLDNQHCGVRPQHRKIDLSLIHI